MAKKQDDTPTKEEIMEVFGAKKKDKDEFFVAVGNLSALKLALLESRKYTLQSMKTFEAIKHIRSKKIEEKNKVRNELKKLYSALNRLKQSIPQINLPPEPLPQQPEEKKPKEEVKQIKPPEPKPVQPSELDRIENELAEIEGKLSNLS